jgi:hypothetical protein
MKNFKKLFIITTVLAVLGICSLVSAQSFDNKETETLGTMVQREGFTCDSADDAFVVFNSVGIPVIVLSCDNKDHIYLITANDDNTLHVVEQKQN